MESFKINTLVSREAFVMAYLLNKISNWEEMSEE